MPSGMVVVDVRVSFACAWEFLVGVFSTQACLGNCLWLGFDGWVDSLLGIDLGK